MVQYYQSSDITFWSEVAYTPVNFTIVVLLPCRFKYAPSKGGKHTSCSASPQNGFYTFISVPFYEGHFFADGIVKENNGAVYK